MGNKSKKASYEANQKTGIHKAGASRWLLVSSAAQKQNNPKFDKVIAYILVQLCSKNHVIQCE